MAEKTLESVVPSAKARKAIAAAGIKTAEALSQVGPEGLLKLGVAESAILDMVDRGVLSRAAPKPAPEAEIEEGDHPIRLTSPHRGQQIQICPGYEERYDRGGRRIHLGLYLKFDNGSAKLTEELWNERVRRLQAVAKTDQERQSVQQWSRSAVVAWLKSRRAYGIDSFIVPE